MEFAALVQQRGLYDRFADAAASAATAAVGGAVSMSRDRLTLALA